MPLKLKDPDHHPFDGSPMIDKAVIKAMVQLYRKNHMKDKNCLNFIHFSLDEVIQLLIDNGVINPDVPISGQLFGFQYMGLKIYLGTHIDEGDCPASPTKPNPYIGMDTAILCNTQLNVHNATWEDQLKVANHEDKTGKSDSISMTGLGEGLDKGSICPPDCPPAPDANGFLHQDVSSS